MYLKNNITKFIFECSKTEDINNLYKKFQNIFIKACVKNCPKKEIYNTNDQKNGQVWWNNELEKEIKYRNKLRKKFNRYKSSANADAYKKQCKRVKKLIRKYKKLYWCKINSNKDINSLYKTVKSLKTKKSNILTLQNMNGKKCFSSFDIANEISCFFSSIGKTLSNHNEFSVGYKNIQKRLMLKKIKSKNSSKIKKMSETFEIDIKSIYNIISNLDTKKSHGCDKIEQQMFKNAPKISTFYCYFLYKKIIKLKQIPKMLNTSKIIPIPKEENEVLPVMKIRPISVLSIVSKILEKIALEQLKKIVYKYNIITNSQTGFMKNKSTYDNLIELYDNMYTTLKQKKIMCVVFLDLKKAYDTVDCMYLLKILKKMGFKGQLYDYLKEFLSNRKGKTYINNTYSKTVDMFHGLPQGSPLSPLLFNLYINHLLSNIKKVKVKAFADDIIIYSVSNDPKILEKNITSEITDLYKKSLSMNMFFSENKCKFMTITSKKNIKLNIKLNNFALEEVDNIKYLGINFDKKIKFDLHLKEILKNRIND